MKKSTEFVEGLSSILVKQHAIKKDEAKALVRAYDERSQATFDDFLLEGGLVSRTDLLNALSAYFQVPSFDCIGYFFDHILLRDFPKDFLFRNNIIPLEYDENSDILTVIAANPSEVGLESRIRQYTDADVVFMVGLRQDIYDSVREFYDISLANEIPDV